MTKVVIEMTFVLISVSIGNVYAQGAGQLTGTVKNISGAVVARSEISATNVETGIRVQTTSNETGTYLLPELAPGVYDVTCQLTGFKTAEQKKPGDRNSVRAYQLMRILRKSSRNAEADQLLAQFRQLLAEERITDEWAAGKRRVRGNLQADGAAQLRSN